MSLSIDQLKSLSKAELTELDRKDNGVVDGSIFKNCTVENENNSSSSEITYSDIFDDVIDTNISFETLKNNITNICNWGKREVPTGLNNSCQSNITINPTAEGGNIAQSALSAAQQMSSTGRCYRGVKQALAQNGVNLTGGSAYMAADQLAGNKNFKEIKINNSELKKLPPGAVVVWNKTNVSPHGHISVALGNGKEASDHVQNQITALRGDSTGFRVFLPSKQNSEIGYA